MSEIKLELIAECASLIKSQIRLAQPNVNQNVNYIKETTILRDVLKQPTELILITHLRMFLIEISVSTVFIHRLICVSVNEGFLIGEFTPTQINCARGKHNVSVFRRLSVSLVTCITFTSILLTHIAVSAQMCQSFHKELF